jgi:hypothetical protein
VEQAKLTRAFTDAALGWVGDKDRTAYNDIFAVEANFATVIITFNHGAKGIQIFYRIFILRSAERSFAGAT